MVPSALIFRELIHKGESLRTCSNLKERFKIDKPAHKEMELNIALQRFKCALKQCFAISAGVTFEPVDEVLVRKETISNNGIGEWLGPT